MALIVNPNVTISLFILLALLLIYRLFSKDLPHITTKLKRISFRRLFKPITLVITLFIVYFICLNILPFNFISYNEIQTKYDYSFYLISSNNLDLGRPTYGTNNGGFHTLLSILYYLFRIDTITKTIAFNKVAETIVFIISFFLIRKILSFFISEKKYRELFSVLLTILYFSLPHITIYLWNQAFYYISAHFLFLLAFASFTDYLKDKYTIDFFISLAAAYLSFLTRPEFAFFVSLLFVMHLANSINLSKFRFQSLEKKEIFCLVIHLLSTLFLAYLTYLFLSSYINPGTLELGRFSDNVSAIADSLLGSFSPFLLTFLITLMVFAILEHKNHAKLELSLISCLLLMLSFIIISNRFDRELYVYYSMIILLLCMIPIINWVGGSTNPLWGRVAIIALVILIVFCNLYLITSKTNLVMVNQVFPGYDRRATLDHVNLALKEYAYLSKQNLTIYDIYQGTPYLAYLLKDTNNRLYNLFDLATLYDNNSNTTQVLTVSWGSCEKKDILTFVDSFYKSQNEKDQQEIGQKYTHLVEFLNQSTFKQSGHISYQTFCRIMAPPKKEEP